MEFSQRHDVLYIDDKRLTIDYLRARLAEQGFDLRSAVSIVDALQHAQETEPDVIVCEERVAGESGMEVIRQLRACDTLREVPIILIHSADSLRRGMVRDAIQLGATDVLLKPIDHEFLSHKLRMHLRMRQLSHERIEFITMLTRDLNGPITSITGFSHLLLRGLYGNLGSPEVATAIQSIAQAGDRLRRQIKQFLCYTRLESEQVEFYFKPLELQRLLVDNIERLKSLPQYENIIVKIRNQRELPLIMADESELDVALQEVLRFTFDSHRAEGGPLLVDVAHEDKTGRLLCSITDAGVGFTNEQLALLFDRYDNINRPSSLRDGFGIGLLISRAIIAGHGGTINVTSVPGEGTTFQLRLPTADPASASSTAKTNTPP